MLLFYINSILMFYPKICFRKQVTINQTDLSGRKAKNIVKVRSLFADLDDAPLTPVLDATLSPHMIVESSKEKYHAYWLVNDCPLDRFSDFQRAIADKFNSDPKVCDLPRVMRLPAFYHCKFDPFPTTIIDLNWNEPYSIKEVEAGLDLDLRRGQKRLSSSNAALFDGSYVIGAYEGERNNTLFKIVCAIRGRGESWDYAYEQAMRFAASCNPTLPADEAHDVLQNVWLNYF